MFTANGTLIPQQAVNGHRQAVHVDTALPAATGAGQDPPPPCGRPTEPQSVMSDREGQADSGRHTADRQPNNRQAGGCSAPLNATASAEEKS